jgi:hypothetical protein
MGSGVRIIMVVRSIFVPFSSCPVRSFFGSIAGRSDAFGESDVAMRFKWAVLFKAAADPDSAQVGLAVAAPELVLVEDGPAEAMAMAVAALAVPVGKD